MASNGVTTAGMTLKWGSSESAITTIVPEVKTMPSFNPTPSTVDITPLSETEFVLYAQGLKDLGGALEFTANLTNELVTAWGAVVTAATSSENTSGSVYFAITHPKLNNSITFQGVPAPIGLNEASVNSALETTLYITPTSAPSLKENTTTP